VSINIAWASQATGCVFLSFKKNEDKPMQTITFNKEGGPIIAEVTSGFAQPGAYGLKLWEKGVNQVVMRQEGNFINDDDDAYPLPEPNELNDGRLIQSVVSLTILPPINEYNVTLKISQDGKELGSVSVSNKTSEQSVILNLFATLKQKEQGETA